MILQKEIRDKAIEWGVPPDTVDKDYVLGHVLAGIQKHWGGQLIFKGGTCLRKCYWPGYRFSEDLDFTSKEGSFVLEAKKLKQVLDEVTAHIGILFHFNKIEPVMFKDIPKGYQVKIKYWGANHSRNQTPTEPSRWTTQIKLDISTAEVLLLGGNSKPIDHPYSDQLLSNEAINCYCIDEVISEKLRSLVQRAYTAPRDYYDLCHLTSDLTESDWKRIKPLFLEKMKHKNLEYEGPDQLVGEPSRTHALRAWKTSIAHQIAENIPSAEETIDTVAQRIKTHL